MSRVVRKVKLKKPFKVTLLAVVFISFGIFLMIFFSSSEELDNKSEIIQEEEEKEVIKVWNFNDDIFTNENNTLLDKIRYIASIDSRFQKIVDDFASYPEEILQMLIKNPDMANFVLNYKEKAGTISSSDVGYVVKGIPPRLFQYDERWGYATYGSGPIAATGCGPTALSMVVTGLTGNNTYTPYVIGKFAEEEGYYTNVGTSWNLMTEGVENFGVTGKELALNKTIIFRELAAGHPVICSMKPGDFTAIGHFIVLVKTENGKIKLNDPNSRERSNMLWDYETLEGQIKNLWAFELKN